MTTTIYLCEDTSRLKALSLDVYFPETELHPVKIAEIVPSLIGKTFCTHSGIILNCIGELISRKEVQFDKVDIIIMYPDRNRITRYDRNGYLINWDCFLEW